MSDYNVYYSVHTVNYGIVQFHLVLLCPGDAEGHSHQTK